MKAFRIDADDNITAYASKQAAQADGEGVFTNSDQLAKLLADSPASRLVDLWNSLPGVAPVKKFEKRGTACKRIFNAIQILEPAEEPAQSADVAPETADVAPKKRRSAKKATPKDKPASRPAAGKKAEVIAMLQRPNGATLQAIMDATGWQAHTTRGFIAGTLGTKMGLKVESFKNSDGQRTYRLQSSQSVAAAN